MPVFKFSCDVRVIFRFVPDLEDIVCFEDLLKDQGNMPEECVVAARIFDSAVGNLAKNFAEGTEYFKVHEAHELK